MPRKKKSRKVGQIGVRKDPDHKSKRVTVPTGKKPGKGKQPGSRNADTDNGGQRGSGKQGQRDPRVGSKRPIQLIKAEEKKYATPAAELAALEADDKLAMLLDKLDNDQPISASEQQYVDTKLERHRVLCELLGLDTDDSDEEDDTDPMDELDAIKLDDYKK